MKEAGYEGELTEGQFLKLWGWTRIKVYVLGEWKQGGCGRSYFQPDCRDFQSRVGPEVTEGQPMTRLHSCSVGMDLVRGNSLLPLICSFCPRPPGLRLPPTALHTRRPPVTSQEGSSGECVCRKWMICPQVAGDYGCRNIHDWHRSSRIADLILSILAMSTCVSRIACFPRPC